MFRYGIGIISVGKFSDTGSRCFLGRICSLQKYKRIIISERYRESAQKLEGAGNSCNIDENTPSLAMSVLKAYRGMGIGTLLLTQMLLAEKAVGYAKISLSVQKDNYAVKLYRKAGFTTVKETTEEYIMVADLNSICKMEEENGF